MVLRGCSVHDSFSHSSLFHFLTHRVAIVTEHCLLNHIYRKFYTFVLHRFLSFFLFLVFTLQKLSVETIVKSVASVSDIDALRLPTTIKEVVVNEFKQQRRHL